MDTSFGSMVAEPEQIIIQNENFYPDISLATFRDHFLIDANVKNLLIVNYLTLAMSRCNRELKSQRQRWQRQGARSLSEVSAAIIGGESEYIQLYRSAVNYAAYAELLSSTERQARTPLDANERMDSAAIYQQKSAFALSSLCGHSRIQVEAL